MNEFYGIFDKDGNLWFDDFDSKEEAERDLECVNNLSLISHAGPFVVALIDG